MSDLFQPLVNPLSDRTAYDLTSDEWPTMALTPVEVSQVARPARRFRITAGWLIFVLCWLPGIAILLWEVLK